MKESSKRDRRTVVLSPSDLSRGLDQRLWESLHGDGDGLNLGLQGVVPVGERAVVLLEGLLSRRVGLEGKEEREREIATNGKQKER